MKFIKPITSLFLIAAITFSLYASADTTQYRSPQPTLNIGDKFSYIITKFEDNQDIPFKNPLLQRNEEYFIQYTFHFEVLELKSQYIKLDIEIGRQINHWRKKEIGRDYWEENHYSNTEILGDRPELFHVNYTGQNKQNDHSILQNIQMVINPDGITLSDNYRGIDKFNLAQVQRVSVVSPVNSSLAHVIRKMDSVFFTLRDEIKPVLPDNIVRKGQSVNYDYRGYSNGTGTVYDSVKVVKTIQEHIKLVRCFDTVVMQSYSLGNGLMATETIDKPNARVRFQLGELNINEIQILYKDPHKGYRKHAPEKNMYYKVHVNNHNTAEFYWKPDDVTFFYLLGNNFSLQFMVAPGDDLFLVADTGSCLENFYWYGNGAEKNQYMVRTDLFKDYLDKVGMLPDTKRLNQYFQTYQQLDLQTQKYNATLYHYFTENAQKLPISSWLVLNNRLEIEAIDKRLSLYHNWYYMNHNRSVRIEKPEFLRFFHVENSLYHISDNYSKLLYNYSKYFNYRTEPGTIQDYILRYTQLATDDFSFFDKDEWNEKRKNLIYDFIFEYPETEHATLLQESVNQNGQGRLHSKALAVHVTNVNGENINLVKLKGNKRTLITSQYIDLKDTVQLKEIIDSTSLSLGKKYNYYALLFALEMPNNNGNMYNILPASDSTTNGLRKWIIRNKLSDKVLIPNGFEKNKIIMAYNIGYYPLRPFYTEKIIIDKNGHIIYRSDRRFMHYRKFNLSVAKEIAHIKTLKNYTTPEKKRRRLTMLISSLISIILVFINIWLINRYRQKKRLRKKEIENRMHQLELKAIRSQMNPHFMFNALASVQNLVSKNQSDEALKYLANFGDLVRKTLNNTDKDEITLHEELSTVELYLKLEQIRSEFEFSIDIDKTIDKNNAYVPPMIVQPFVENALLHGLLPKEKGERQLKIIADVFENQLRITINDNGIGRQAAAQLEGKKNGKAIKLLKERIAILSEKTNDKYAIEIEDKFDNGAASGTKVVIILPND